MVIKLPQMFLGHYCSSVFGFHITPVFLASYYPDISITNTKLLTGYYFSNYHDIAFI